MSRVICALFLLLALATARAEGQPPNQPPPNQPPPNQPPPDRIPPDRIPLDRIPPHLLGNPDFKYHYPFEKRLEEIKENAKERERILYWVRIIGIALAGSIGGGAWAWRKAAQEDVEHSPPAAPPRDWLHAPQPRGGGVGHSPPAAPPRDWLTIPADRRGEAPTEKSLLREIGVLFFVWIALAASICVAMGRIFP